MRHASAIALLVLVIPLFMTGQSSQSEQACFQSLSGFSQDPATTAPPPFPSSLDDVALELFESGCYGSCPAFRLTLRADAAVFEGHAYVRAKGTRKAKLRPKEFEQFVQAWFEGKLFAMRDEYCNPKCPDGTTIVVTDVQWTTIELRTPRFQKKVSECYFTTDGEPGMPRPPRQYFELRRKLVDFAKAKHWL